MEDQFEEQIRAYVRHRHFFDDDLRPLQRTTIITKREDYLHVEYRTKTGFVDDVGFHLDEMTRRVHFRSASRVGCSDLGINRKRMEEFTALYRAVEY